MKYLIGIVLLISSCGQISSIDRINSDSLILENSKLKLELDSFKAASQKENEVENITNGKYYFVLLTFTKNELEGSTFSDHTYVAWSSILWIDNYNEENKYRLMDKFEGEFRTTHFLEKIVKRDFFAFDTYTEASKYLEVKKGLE